MYACLCGLSWVWSMVRWGVYIPPTQQSIASRHPIRLVLAPGHNVGPLDSHVPSGWYAWPWLNATLTTLTDYTRWLARIRRNKIELNSIKQNHKDEEGREVMLLGMHTYIHTYICTPACWLSVQNEANPNVWMDWILFGVFGVSCCNRNFLLLIVVAFANSFVGLFLGFLLTVFPLIFFFLSFCVCVCVCACVDQRDSATPHSPWPMAHAPCPTAFYRLRLLM